MKKKKKKKGEHIFLRRIREIFSSVLLRKGLFHTNNAYMFPRASCSSESSWIQLLFYFPAGGLWIIKIRRKGAGLFYSSTFMANKAYVHLYSTFRLWGSSRSFPSVGRVIFYCKRSYVKPSRQFMFCSLLNKVVPYREF